MHEYDLILLLALGFAIALALGYLTQRLRLSSILGYLLAGIIVGPFSPGLHVDGHLAMQLSEVGVILLLFGVGLHFNIKDLLGVKKISLPGAIVQSLTATALSTVFLHWLGYSWGAGLIVGMSVSVASTVVLVRVLSDNNVLNTSQGHIAVGWLIVEDIFTVLMLVLLPALGGIILNQDSVIPLSIFGFTLYEGETGLLTICLSFIFAIAKMGLLAIAVLVGGKRFIPWILTKVAHTRSRELFTLSVLALALLIATASVVIFEASFALGAFLAGMAVGQSKLGEQAAADALPMKDAFAVLFFVAVGMLFNPVVLFEQTKLFLLLMAVILIAKPLAALAVVIILGYSTTTAFTVAIALAQIGEFSFILAGEARKLGLLSIEKESTLIAAAILSLALNPLLFRLVPVLEKHLSNHKKAWEFFNWRAMKRLNELEYANNQAAEGQKKAIIVGHGPVGRIITRLFKQAGVHPIIIDMNIDTITYLNERGINAIFGDASKVDILKAAGMETAKYLVVTPPGLNLQLPVINAAKSINNNAIIYSRAKYISEKEMMENLGLNVSYDELESAVIMAGMVLRSEGFSEEQILEEIKNVREELSK